MRRRQLSPGGVLNADLAALTHGFREAGDVQRFVNLVCLMPTTRTTLPLVTAWKWSP